MNVLFETAREQLARRIANKEAQIGILGLGYVGLPLALEFSKSGFQTFGVEIDDRKVLSINQGRSYIADISHAEIAQELVSQKFRATTNTAILKECDCIIICVPTPLSRTNDPDLAFIESATATIKHYLRPGQLVVLESTTYPGCTDELVRKQLEETGLMLDLDFLLAFSPERIDPGNKTYKATEIPRIVGGCSPDSTAVAAQLYMHAVPEVHVVSSARVAETAKLLENTFRAVNIGLVNELALMCYQMNIDIWEAIEAASTKPYGFMPFYPGPGIGGHCIPLDPAYLSWRGRQFGVESRFIEVAENVNASMPEHVVHLVGDALNDLGKPLNGAGVLVLGASYKKDVADLRESPAIEIIQGLRSKKARVSYHDPLIAGIDFERLQAKLRREMIFTGVNRRQRNRQLAGSGTRRSNDALCSVPLTDAVLSQADCVLIVTDHSTLDYEQIVHCASLIVDTRNAIPKNLRSAGGARIVRL